MTDGQAELESLAAIVAAAGVRMAAASRQAGFMLKPDGSPVTGADVACERALARALAASHPGLVVVGEESAPADGRLPPDDVIALIDPLDGTRAFAAGGDDFCICLAIVEKGEPRVGVIGAPARGIVYAGAIGPGGSVAWRAAVGADGRLDSERAPLAVRRGHRPPAALVSERHGDDASLALLDRLGAVDRISLSSALKFAVIAEGAADIYPRMAPTMGWDTAAGQAILAAAGGVTLDPWGAPLRYPPGAPLRNPGFVAIGDPALAGAIFG